MLSNKELASHIYKKVLGISEKKLKSDSFTSNENDIINYIQQLIELQYEEHFISRKNVLIEKK
jgi:hypothetical protein